MAETHKVCEWVSGGTRKGEGFGGGGLYRGGAWGEGGRSERILS